MNAWFAAGAVAIGNGAVNWVGGSFRTLLLDATFVPVYDSASPVPNITNASNLSDVISAAVGSPVDLTGKTNVAGVLNAANPVFPLVIGNTVVAQIVYKWTGSAATSTLLFFWDTGTGFPIIPIGGDIDGFWDTGVLSGIAGLTQI